MISRLTVRHLAVVEDIELTFEQGMSSLTGETGAGKSILVDALSLVLGDRADSKMIRFGHDRAEISASFETSHNRVLQQWLIEQELDDDDQCDLRRTITKDGRSKGYINGRPVPLSQLREVSMRSIDIHGQHAHQSLLRPTTQRTLLDIVAKTKPLLDDLSTAFHEWQSLQKQVQHVEQQSQDHSARLELLQYQVKELEQFELTEHAINQLLQDQRQLANASQLIQSAESGLFQLFEQEQNSAYSIISRTLSELEKYQDIEPKFNNSIEILNSTMIQLDECGGELRNYLDSAETDPDKLAQVEQQVSLLHGFARKHQVEIEQLPEFFQALCDELDNLSNLDENNEKLQQKLIEQQQKCIELCKKITAKRQKTIGPLSKKITQSIQQLAMPHGYVEFSLTPMTNEQFTETGADQVQLLVSTNPGQTAGELSKVASGGELARISLAIQVVTAGTRSVPTLVFDEVDVGIGGGVAEVVGKHLRQLATTQQVICITHLPQVAAQAQQQLHVSKHQSGDSTHIDVRKLDKLQRIEEISRMLGGVNITEKTRSHAEEMLVLAEK